MTVLPSLTARFGKIVASPHLGSDSDANEASSSGTVRAGQPGLLVPLNLWYFHLFVLQRSTPALGRCFRRQVGMLSRLILGSVGRKRIAREAPITQSP